VTLGFFREALDDYLEASLGLPGLLPMEQVQSDLNQAIEDGGRPRDGWVWEKIAPPAVATSSRSLQKLGQGVK
jgi:hypothetical protein